MDRRHMLAILSASGLGTPLFHRALTGLWQENGESGNPPKVTADMVRTAEWISGCEFNDEERESIARSINRSAAGKAMLRAQPLDFFDGPALNFQPLCPAATSGEPPQRSVPFSQQPVDAMEPATDTDIAFLPVTRLARLIRDRDISSTDLTRIYLERLEKYNPLLNCVVTLTRDLALTQARQADEEIAAGHWRGPLHGIPWGAKDLVSVPGYPTTWGIPQFEQRVLEQPATVASRLADAGAVLVAKLSLGAIAMGDRWFRGMTRSPWDYRIGSSGSSAGSASATVAGLVGFSLGSETLGSIVSPCRRCGATGLRPTFGRVSRAGCMPLSWSMDKIGPITRSVEDCALVFAAIHGADGEDPTATNRDFAWPLELDFSQLKIGYTASPRPKSDSASAPGDGEESGKPDRPDLQILRELGCQVVEVELPEEKNQWFLADIIDVESASVFDDMLRARQTEGWNTWPDTFRAARFVSAIDYLKLLRRRRQLQFKMESLMDSVDFLVNCSDLLITNLTGHPSVVMPMDYREVDGRQVPVSLLLTGGLNDDDRLLALGQACQQRLVAHRRRPPLDRLLAEQAAEARGDRESSGDSTPDDADGSGKRR